MLMLICGDLEAFVFVDSIQHAFSIPTKGLYTEHWTDASQSGKIE